ncbi:ABC transporter ATP-binding protein/permease [Corynebacterium comes]|uniref:ATP-binding/permease protein CydD n=1 Tax=Corynebacterium comes TaxID=2675218 RepID=A0A6B8VZ29_9CORY|nr:ATP-binding cassette domain-containing protein [Corynebacterium comes]QGU05461.1 ATP-binding/permease protein CydD [Corynebacterium comes]
MSTNRSPVDPRLLRLAPPVRSLILRAGLAQALTTMLVLARGVLIGWGATRLIVERVFPWWVIPALVAVVAAHGAVSWVAQRWSSRGVGATIDSLRASSLEALRRRDPRVVQEQSAHWRTVLTRGLDDFRPYLSDFLPSLVAVVLATPAALLVVFLADPVSGVLALVTVPLIPVFMVLIGTLTRAQTRRRLQITAALGGQLADLLSGALTLRALGATDQPGREIEASGRRHENATMSVLRLAFLSSFALEFIATLSVALVAVGIGLRLIDGSLGLSAGLIALIVIPEVYQPIRQVGTNFHAAADGLAAVEEVLELIDAPSHQPPFTPQRREGVALEVSGLSVAGRDGTTPTDLSFRAEPGEVTVLHGPNGSGKSTAFLAVLGVLPKNLVHGQVVAPAPEAISYLPARPVLTPGTVKDNLVLLGAEPARAEAAAAAVGTGVPGDRILGAHGSGISAGQSQRLALARTLARGDGGPMLLLLDEPSAHLSPELVEHLGMLLRQYAAEGHAVVVASHDRRIAAAADKVVPL